MNIQQIKAHITLLSNTKTLNKEVECVLDIYKFTLLLVQIAGISYNSVNEMLMI